MQINSLSTSFILTADIGGSHITAGICHLESYSILSQSITRVEVNSKGPAESILARWESAFEQVLQKNITATVSGLSIAMPGPFDYEKGISYIKGLDKYETLYGMDIKQHLADLLTIDPAVILFKNDAESTVAGEVLSGAGRNYQRVMGITLGTGFGSAFTENAITKDLNLGSDAYRDTIADDYLSTRWFLRRYLELTGTNLTGGVRALAAMAPDSAVARDIFAEFANNMSEFLSGPFARYSPEVLVVCGNIAKAAEFFLPQLSKKLNAIPVKLAQLGENAPLIGAAAMFNSLNTAGSSDSVTKL
ncbi:ROK family protein [Mucilaginibacter gotjawali]|uniref:N-acetyl-D-glucosamine kinase n=2 Tax=Mucilaginibacter gotjawali TaxID=1550579 RepID=A0A0X8X4S8_9SPHI|nr:ROK family protein [Mucilaginibacter gotjawali]MBB3058486.1 glucokinase [Mucilaginibacter gotjawali]BAU55710.1 N-acetyl-D-glucosamine kinase [Mucilaginibacter gotjawali]